jgi:ribosome-associated toxin RatA of RatAB toxin-antitoxin module
MIMYSLDLRIHVNIEPRRLLSIWKQPRLLLKEASGIRDLRVVARKNGVTVTHWDVEVDGVLLSWRQRDTLEIRNRRVLFEMEQGEFKRYEGIWEIERDPQGGTVLRVQAVIDWGLQVIGPFVEPVLERKSRAMFRSFLNGIKKAAEDYAREKAQR